MRSECFFATPQMFCSNIPQQPSKVWCLQRHWCAEKCHTADAAFQCTVCLWKLQIASLLDSSIILGSCIFFSFSLSFPLLPFATLQSDSHAWIRFLKFPLPNIKEALQIDFCLCATLVPIENGIIQRAFQNDNTCGQVLNRMYKRK